MEPINVVREHPRNKDCLFVGTELGVFVSFDGGGNWYTMQNDMPTVACHDLMVHPREMDLIVGTHGRGIYVMDIAPFEELTAAVAEERLSRVARRRTVSRRPGDSTRATSATGRGTLTATVAHRCSATTSARTPANR